MAGDVCEAESWSGGPHLSLHSQRHSPRWHTSFALVEPHIQVVAEGQYGRCDTLRHVVSRQVVRVQTVDQHALKTDETVEFVTSESTAAVDGVVAEAIIHPAVEIDASFMLTPEQTVLHQGNDIRPEHVLHAVDLQLGVDVLDLILI